MGGTRSQRFDVNQLKDPVTKHQFKVALMNKFDILQDITAITIDTFNKAMTEAAKETIGYRKSAKAEWISVETWNTIEERRQMKKKLIDSKSPRLKERAATQYRTLDKQVKMSARNDNVNT